MINHSTIFDTAADSNTFYVNSLHRYLFFCYNLLSITPFFGRTITFYKVITDIIYHI